MTTTKARLVLDIGVIPGGYHSHIIRLLQLRHPPVLIIQRAWLIRVGDGGPS